MKLKLTSGTELDVEMVEGLFHHGHLWGYRVSEHRRAATYLVAGVGQSVPRWAQPFVINDSVTAVVPKWYPQGA